MLGTTWVQAGEGLGGLATVVLVLGGGCALLWRVFTKVRDILDVLQPNGGESPSVGDTIPRIEAAINDPQTGLVALNTRIVRLEGSAVANAMAARTEVDLQTAERLRVHDLPAAAGGTA